jgi:hypothetical protein
VEARQAGSSAAEVTYPAELAEMPMNARDWIAASLHIDRLSELKDSKLKPRCLLLPFLVGSYKPSNIVTSKGETLS